MTLSVILCTHNPRETPLRRTLAALRAQTLTPPAWELLLVDNASAPPLSGGWDVAWHPAARHVREDELGLTPARLRGIREARGEVLVFVDDDNVLDPDYLEQARRIFEEHPFLGVIGGKIAGEYETPPPPWARPYLGHLAIVDRGEHALYALMPGPEPFVPVGAGMAVRRAVARHYARQVEGSALRRRLDAVGAGLARAGDTDLALCAFEAGLARGYYPQLKLTHLIPASRLEISYLERLCGDGEHSRYTLALARGLPAPPPPARLGRRLLTWLRERRMEPHRARLERALRRGRERAFADHAAGSPRPAQTGGAARP